MLVYLFPLAHIQSSCMKHKCLRSYYPWLKVLSCSGCSQPWEVCVGAGEWMLPSATPVSTWSIFCPGSRTGGAPAEPRAAEQVSPAVPCPAAFLETEPDVLAGFAGQKQLLSCCVSQITVLPLLLCRDLQLEQNRNQAG